MAQAHIFRLDPIIVGTEPRLMDDDEIEENDFIQDVQFATVFWE